MVLQQGRLTRTGAFFKNNTRLLKKTIYNCDESEKSNQWNLSEAVNAKSSGVFTPLDFSAFSCSTDMDSTEIIDHETTQIRP